MPSQEKDIFLRGLFIQVGRERKTTVRPIYERARRSEATLASVQLPISESSQLRATVAEDPENVTAEEEAGGVFWHVWGYSTLGGPDKLRPE